jgi:hypothetical protein
MEDLVVFFSKESELTAWCEVMGVGDTPVWSLGQSTNTRLSLEWPRSLVEERGGDGWSAGLIAPPPH